MGPAKFKPEHLRVRDEVGLVRGLAYTSVGGEVLDVEAAVVDGSGRLELTGNLGDVMKESARAAMTYIRSRAGVLGIEHDFYKTKDIHIHFPEGAVPKDGPSAGITVTIALISALTGVPVRHDVAMTGEITLRGRVLPIGGLKEKTLAAKNAGIRTCAQESRPLSSLPTTKRILRTLTRQCAVRSSLSRRITSIRFWTSRSYAVRRTARSARRSLSASAPAALSDSR
jgi:ATP-dependent Lon protease